MNAQHTLGRETANLQKSQDTLQLDKSRVAGSAGALPRA